MTTAAWKIESNVILLVHGNSDPSTEDWDGFIADMAAQVTPGARFRSLIVTPGSGPNMRQRKQMNDVLSEVTNIGAVVTGSAMARTVVSIIRLRNPDLRAFEPGQLEAALEYLQFTPSEKQKMRTTIEALRKEVGLVGAL